MLKTSLNYRLFSLLFILTPPLAMGLIGMLAIGQTVDVLQAVIADILAPTMAATGLAAAIGWAVFLRRPLRPPCGSKAGLLTVFLCYLLGLMPLALAAGSWDGLTGTLTSYLTLFFFSQISTFWITYPIGLLFGRWVAKRLLL